MADQKLDNLLNLAIDSSKEEREKSQNLNVGYDSKSRMWEVIVKYSQGNGTGESGTDGIDTAGSMEILGASQLGGPGISVVPLLGGYAIVTLPESMLDEYSSR